MSLPTYRPTIISGAQTGADQGGLSAALLLGLPTGGFIPKGGRTDEGFQPALIAQYKLTETESRNYRDRTILNVSQSNVTIWFGDASSAGGILTCKATIVQQHPLLKLPFHASIYNDALMDTNIHAAIAFLRAHTPSTINIAGNRERTNPGIFLFTRRVLHNALSEVISDV